MKVSQPLHNGVATRLGLSSLMGAREPSVRLRGCRLDPRVSRQSPTAKGLQSGSESRGHLLTPFPGAVASGMAQSPQALCLKRENKSGSEDIVFPGHRSS